MDIKNLNYQKAIELLSQIAIILTPDNCKKVEGILSTYGQKTCNPLDETVKKFNYLTFSERSHLWGGQHNAECFKMNTVELVALLEALQSQPKKVETLRSHDGVDLKEKDMTFWVKRRGKVWGLHSVYSVRISIVNHGYLLESDKTWKVFSNLHAAKEFCRKNNFLFKTDDKKNVVEGDIVYTVQKADGIWYVSPAFKEGIKVDSRVAKLILGSEVIKAFKSKAKRDQFIKDNQSFEKVMILVSSQNELEALMAYGQRYLNIEPAYSNFQQDLISYDKELSGKPFYFYVTEEHKDKWSAIMQGERETADVRKELIAAGYGSIRMKTYAKQKGFEIVIKKVVDLPDGGRATILKDKVTIEWPEHNNGVILSHDEINYLYYQIKNM